MKYFYLLLIFFSSFYQSQTPVNWQLLNPKPSAATGSDIKMLSTDLGYFITDTEIIQTQDGGITWNVKQKLNSTQAIDFKDNIGVVVGMYGTLMLSNDSGITWISKGFSNNENFIYAKVLSANKILIATKASFYLSNDGGLTWTQKSIPNYNVSKIIFLNENIGILGTQDGKIYKTIDGGNNWVLKSSVNYTPSNFFTLYFVNDNVGFAERGHGELIKTTNGGETWTLLSTLSDEIYSFCFLDENIGYAAGEDGVIYKTSDGGQTWIHKFFQDNFVGDTDLHGIYFNSENIGFAVGMRGRIIKTTNGGNNWSQYSPFYNDVSTINKVDNQLFARVGLDVFKSTDDGNSWSALARPTDFLTPDPYRIFQYSSGMTFLNKNVGYLIGGVYDSNSRIYKTEDGGQSWILKQNFAADLIHNLSFIDENVGFVACGEGTMRYGFYRTMDGGNTWETQNTKINFSKIKPFSKDLVYASTYNSLYKSTDGGKNWTLIFNDDNQAITDINFIDQNNGFILGNQGFKMRRTTDGGATWTKLEVPYDFYNLVRFKTKNIGIIANEYGKILNTYDGGRTWKTDYKLYGKNDLIFNDNDIYVAGFYGKIFKGKYAGIPDYVLTTNEVTDFSAKRAKFTGSAASNSTEITDLKFVYSKSPNFSNPIFVPADNMTVNALASNDINFENSNLEANTTYYIKTSGKINGSTIYGNTVHFTTLPSYSLNIYESYSDLATSKNLSGFGSANDNALNDIKFQYSTNETAFDLFSAADPSEIEQGKTNITLSTSLQNLKPNTKYYARIQADYEGDKVYSNVINFTTTEEYSLTVSEVNVNLTTLPLSAVVYANDKDITDLVFEYGGSDFENSIAADANMVVGHQVDFVSASLVKSTLFPNKVYYLRLKGNTGGKVIYSNKVLFNTDKSLIIAKDKNEDISSTEVEIKGLVKSYAYYPLTDISVEYGKTSSLGMSSATTPSYANTTSTLSIAANLTQLEPGTYYFYRFSGIQNGVKQYSDMFEFTTSQLAVTELNEDKFQIYPNPVGEKLFFMGKEKIHKIEIYDYSGKVVFAQKSQNIDSVNIENLIQGNYIIKIYSPRGVYSGKFIKK